MPTTDIEKLAKKLKAKPGREGKPVGFYSYSPSDWEKFKRVCKAGGVSASEILNAWIGEALAKWEKTGRTPGN